jgi:tRNA(fMet)-specific endonuclease VapC
MACLDTTLLIDLSHPRKDRGGRAAQKVIELAERGELLTTARFSVAELYVGVELARVREWELESVHRTLSTLMLLEFNDSAAWWFAKNSAHLRRIGRPAGDLDVLIAATAMAHGHTLVTRNASHFANIPYLEVETY